MATCLLCNSFVMHSAWTDLTCNHSFHIHCLIILKPYKCPTCSTIIEKYNFILSTYESHYSKYIFEFIINNEYNIVKSLLKYFYHNIIKFYDKNGQSLLHYVNYIEVNYDMIRLLLQYGINPNSVDNNLNTTLHYSCLFNRYDIVDILLSHGCSLNHQNILGFTALHIACQYNHIDSIKRLLNNSSNMLNYYSTNINVKEKHGNTPLHIVAVNNNVEIAKLLLKHGADFHIKNNNGDTPLHIACKNHSFKVFNLFIESNANLNIVNNHNMKVFDYMWFDPNHPIYT